MVGHYHGVDDMVVCARYVYEGGEVSKSCALWEIHYVIVGSFLEFVEWVA